MNSNLVAQVSEDGLKDMVLEAARKVWGDRPNSVIDLDLSPIQQVIRETVEKHIKGHIAANLDEIMETIYPQIRNSIDFATAEYMNDCVLSFLYGEGFEKINAKYRKKTEPGGKAEAGNSEMGRGPR